jgi:hypothetical protein
VAGETKLNDPVELPAAMFVLRGLQWILWTLAWFVALVCVVWGFGALHYDSPFWRSGVPWVFALAVLGAIIFVRNPWRKIGAAFAAFALVLAWWLTLKPSNVGDWLPDVARLAWAEIDGDQVTLHNVRNCEYRTETDYTPHWETRIVRFSQITGIDVAMNYWGSPWIAHPILSFQFADAAPICFSIETRKKRGQTYSAIGGLYRQFALIYIVADERDVIRVRTNYRQGEDVYLYRTTVTPEQARARFREYVVSLNRLHEQPRWYNAITTNCTTSIRQQHATAQRIPWDWRILANGKADELMYERQTIATGGDLSFDELKRRALINSAAKAANDAEDFSRRIRENLVRAK